MFMQFKQLTLSLCIFGLSAASCTNNISKSKQNIEEYKLDNGFRISACAE
jgi:zinc protease